MSEGGCLALLAVAMLVIMGAAFAITDADRPHDRCVEARRVELIVGMKARHCPPIGWWREPNGHTGADHA